MAIRHAGKSWTIDVYTKTGRQRLSGFTTKKEAELVQRMLLNDIDDTPGVTGMTVNQLHDEWLEQYIAGGVTKSSLYKTNGFWKRDIKPLFGNQDLSMVTSQDVQKWLNKGANKWVSFVKNAGQLRALFEYAVHMGYLEETPFNKVTMPHRKPAKEKQTWSDTEYQQWLDYLYNDLWYTHKQQSVYLLLLTKTGMRRQEIGALTLKDIDFKRRTIRINKALKYGQDGVYLGSTKTKDSNRVIGIDQDTASRLQDYIQSRELNPHILFTTGGEDKYMSFNRPYKWFKRAIAQAGVPDIGGLHALRHQYTTVAIKAGISPKLVQKQLGHSNVEITMDVYTHVNNDEVLKIADILEDGTNVF